MTMVRRGQLYWAWLDKRRPALVISGDARNERANDVIVVPCTTHLLESPTHVRLRRGEGGLPRDSVLKCEQIHTLVKSDIEQAPLGLPLRAGRIAEVERAIMRAIGIPIR